MADTSFGQMVRAARHKAHWTQADVAGRVEKHGVALSQPQVSSIERNVFTPDIWMVTALCLVLRILPQEALHALGWVHRP